MPVVYTLQLFEENEKNTQIQPFAKKNLISKVC